MFFRLLRRFFADDEFLETRARLQEAQSLLAKYETTLKALEKKNLNEAEKVDPDFLGLVWAFLGILAYFVTLANKNLLIRLEEIGIGNIFTYFTYHIANNTATEANFPFTIMDGIWFFMYFTCFFLLAVNIVFGIRLVRQYAKQKTDTGYSLFAKSLVNFIVFYIIWNLLLIIGTIGQWMLRLLR